LIVLREIARFVENRGTEAGAGRPEPGTCQIDFPL